MAAAPSSPAEPLFLPKEERDAAQLLAEALARDGVEIHLNTKASTCVSRRRENCPWCTYTDPEIAHVGVYVRQARERGIPVKTFTMPMHDVDRAITDGEESGFVKIHVRDGSDQILGAAVVARHAGEMINDLSLAMVAGIGLATIARVIHAYRRRPRASRRQRWPMSARQRLDGWFGCDVAGSPAAGYADSVKLNAPTF